MLTNIDTPRLGCLCINYCYGRANVSQRCALAEKLIQTTPFSNIWCIRLIVLNENTQKSEHIISSTAVFFFLWTVKPRGKGTVTSQPTCPAFGKMFCRPCFIFHFYSLKAKTRVFSPSLNLVFYCLSFY